MIVFENGARLMEAEYPLPYEPSVLIRTMDMLGQTRECLRLTVYCGAAEAAEHFSAGARYGREEDGSYYDFSVYRLPGDIIDHRDGRVTVFMGRPTEQEKRIHELVERITELSACLEEAESRVRSIEGELKMLRKTEEV